MIENIFLLLMWVAVLSVFLVIIGVVADVVLDSFLYRSYPVAKKSRGDRYCRDHSRYGFVRDCEECKNDKK